MDGVWSVELKNGKSEILSEPIRLGGCTLMEGTNASLYVISKDSEKFTICRLNEKNPTFSFRDLVLEHGMDIGVDGKGIVSVYGTVDDAEDEMDMDEDDLEQALMRAYGGDMDIEDDDEMDFDEMEDESSSEEEPKIVEIPTPAPQKKALPAPTPAPAPAPKKQEKKEVPAPKTPAPAPTPAKDAKKSEAAKKVDAVLEKQKDIAANVLAANAPVVATKRKAEATTDNNNKKNRTEEAPTTNVKKQLPSGTTYEVLKTGTAGGPVATKGRKCTVKYEGRLKNGVKFDAGTFDFPVGMGDVVKGFDAGVLGMLKGERRMVHIPASQGYGNKKAGKIPPNSDLIFDITLLNVK